MGFSGDRQLNSARNAEKNVAQPASACVPGIANPPIGQALIHLCRSGERRSRENAAEGGRAVRAVVAIRGATDYSDITGLSRMSQSVRTRLHRSHRIGKLWGQNCGDRLRNGGNRRQPKDFPNIRVERVFSSNAFLGNSHDSATTLSSTRSPGGRRVAECRSTDFHQYKHGSLAFPSRPFRPLPTLPSLPNWVRFVKTRSPWTSGASLAS